MAPSSGVKASSTTNARYDSPCAKAHHRKGDLMNPSVLKRFSAMVYGLIQASLIPQGPCLAYSLSFGDGDAHLVAHWEEAVYRTALLLSVLTLGRSFGSILGRARQTATRYSVCSSALVARIGGIALIVFYLTTSGSITSYKLLTCACLISGVLAGILVGMTRSIDLPEDYYQQKGGEAIDGHSFSDVLQSDLTPGVTRMYLLGFSMSILLQFLWLPEQLHGRAHIITSQTSVISLLSCAGVMLLLQALLRVVFSYCSSADERCAYALDLNRRQVHGSNNRLRSRSNHDLAAASSEQSHSPIARNAVIASTAQMEIFEQAASVRSRFDSNMSTDEFFDCHSVLSQSDLDDILLCDEEAPFSPAPLSNVARYLDNVCVFDDGSSAYVPPGECIHRIPSTYLEFHKGNHFRAKAAWEASQKWRLEQRVWKIHTLPNPWFSKIKEAYPHFVHGHSKAGFPIIYEQPGRMDLNRLFAEGCQVDDMLYCYTFFMEFVSNVVCKREEIRAKLGPNPPPHSSSTWGIMVVMDVKGAGLSQLSGNVARYVKKAGDINSAHYPMSMKRAFVINAPFWLGGAWSGIKGILPDSVQVDILSERMFPEALREYIDDDQIPPDYGGSNPYILGQHPYEVELRQLVNRLSRAGEDERLDNRDGTLVVVSTSRAELTSASDSSTSCTSSATCDPAFTSWQSSGRTLAALRRRINSVDHPQAGRVADTFWKGHVQSSTETRHFAVATFLIMSFYALQGALEVSIPFWILSPTVVGGLGIGPHRSSVTIFSSSFLLLCMARKKHLECVLRVSQQLPLRMFRISVGAESVLLAALAFPLFKVPSHERMQSVVITGVTIVMLAFLAAANGIGRVTATRLHLHSALCMAKHTSLPSAWVHNQLESGRVSRLLPPIAESTGMVLAAPFLCWCLSNAPPFYIYASLLLLSWCFLLLFVSTFSRYVRVSLRDEGTFGAVSKNRGHPCCPPLLGDVMAASTGDMASLLEEGRLTPILRRPVPSGAVCNSSKPSNRVRSFSDTSLFLDPAAEHDGFREDFTSISPHKAN